MANARQDDHEYDKAAVHTTHEGQRTDMSNFMDQVTMMRSWREPRSLGTATATAAPAQTKGHEMRWMT